MYTHAQSKHILTAVLSFGRNGHGNPIRTTFEYAGWRANTRYSARTQRSDFEIPSHIYQCYLRHHTHGQTRQLFEKPYFLWVHLHTVFTQIWSCWYKISTSLNQASSVKRLKDVREAWKPFSLHTCSVPVSFIRLICCLWGKLESWPIMCVYKVIVDCVLRYERMWSKREKIRWVACLIWQGVPQNMSFIVQM